MLKRSQQVPLPTLCWRLSADPLRGAFFSLGTKLCWELVKPLSQRSNEWFSAALKGSEYAGQPASRSTLRSKELDLPFPEMFPHFRRLKMEGISLRSARTLSSCNCLLLQSSASAASWFNPTSPHLQKAAEHRPPSAWESSPATQGMPAGIIAPLANPGLLPKSLQSLQSSEAALEGRVTAPHLLLAGGHWSNLHKIPQMPAWNLCHSLSAGN